MANFGTNFITISKFWTDLKAVLSSKSLLLQYDETSEIYELFAIDGPIVYLATIYKGVVPDGVLPVYSQSQNDSDKIDFGDNFKAFANRPVGLNFTSTVDGYVTTSGSTTTAIMASAYTEQTANAQRSLVSTSSTDTSAGTGARTVEITYYDQTLSGPFTETVTLNGTSAVNTVATDICFIESMAVITVGSNGGNAGTISLMSSTAGGGVTIGSILTGDNETNWCHHYVGANKRMALIDVSGSIKGTYSGRITVRQFFPLDSTKADHTITPAVFISAGGYNHQDFTVPVNVEGPSKVVLYAKGNGSSGNMDWVAGFGYYEG